jgi:uncharacterized protein (TIGR03437 family)
MKFAARVLLVLWSCALFTASGQTRYIINTIAGSASLGDNGPAAQALLWQPYDVAVDAAGNAYIADAYNARIRKVNSAGIITTIACTGVAGYGGDGGPATQARCNSPSGIAVDTAGNVYFSDSTNQRVRKIGLDGIISTVAGNGLASFSGDGGPAIAASLNYPAGLLAYAGNLYIADRYNQRIRCLTLDGNINTVAGGGSGSLVGDGGMATLAQLSYPRGLAVDPQGRILIADTNNSRIRRFIPGGTITTIAGEYQGFFGDNGPATSADLNEPEGVAVDKNGVIYISDYGNQRIRAISTNGTISTITGSVAGFAGDNGSAATGLINSPQGITTDSQGNLYIADTGNNRVRMISTADIITTFAGRGNYAGDNGPAISATFSEPSFATLDSAGDLYVSDQDNYVVRKIDTSGKITTIAGTGISGSTGDGGAATSARFASPQGLAFDNSGNLYVVDGIDNTVRMITPAGTISRVAGGGTSLGDGGPAQIAMLNYPHGIAIDGKGNIYIADNQNNRVRRITPDGVINTFIGNGSAASTGDGGLASAAAVNEPWDVKIANDGTIYISEFYGNRVRAVSPAGIVRTAGLISGHPTGIALDPAGDIIVAASNQIFSLNSAGVVTAIAGQGGYGFAGDGGPALQALLNNPWGGVAADAKGNIYVCDQMNNRIRELTPDPVSQVVAVSGNQQSGTAGTTLALPLEVQVNGASGLPFPGVTVMYAITSGGGTLSAKQTVTGPDGKAAVTLTLPAAAGLVTVTATVTGLSPVLFTATALNMPASITILNGNNQTGIAGSTLPELLAVKVLGVEQAPFAGATVTFAVTSGIATLSPASMSTGTDGSAYTQVTLGDTAGELTISATVTGLPVVTFSLTATPVNGPQILAGGVVGAGLSTPPVQITAPNAMVSIFGKNFAPVGTSRSVTSADLVNGMVPTNLAGVCVLFGTQRAPIFLVTPGQLNVQVPQVTVPGTPAVQVIAGCDTPDQVTSTTVNVAVQQASPEFFYAANNGTGRNPVAATDGVTGAGIGDPARLGPGFALAYPGETVTIYATGLGLSSPAFAAGQLPPGEAQVSGVTVSMDGAPLDPSAIQYAGVAPHNAGLYQLNVVLPAFLTSGDHTISMSMSGRSSPAGYITVGATISQLVGEIASRGFFHLN